MKSVNRGIFTNNTTVAVIYVVQVIIFAWGDIVLGLIIQGITLPCQNITYMSISFCWKRVLWEKFVVNWQFAFRAFFDRVNGTNTKKLRFFLQFSATNPCTNGNQSSSMKITAIFCEIFWRAACKSLNSIFSCTDFWTEKFWKIYWFLGRIQISGHC